jgi:hypothetical protein
VNELQPATMIDHLVQSYIEQSEATDREYQRHINEVKDTTSLVTKTPWLRHTKWEERFVGQDMKVLHDLTNPPETRDYAGRHVWDTTGKILARCWDGFQNVLERGWELLPHWIASAVRDKESTRPFRSYVAPYTLRRYYSYWQSYVLFCLRASEMEDTPLEFTLNQRQLLEKVRRLMQEDDEAGLERSLLDLFTKLICHSDYAKERSSLIYFTGVMGYNVEWKQWRQPHDYTTILAGLQFILRIVMLESVLPMDMRDLFDEESERNPVEIFCEMRNQWLIDGEGTYYYNDTNSEVPHLDISIVYSTMAWLQAKISPHDLVFAGHRTIRLSTLMDVD